MLVHTKTVLNPFALRKIKIAHNFGLSECNRVKTYGSNNSSDMSVGPQSDQSCCCSYTMYELKHNKTN